MSNGSTPRHVRHGEELRDFVIPHVRCFCGGDGNMTQQYHDAIAGYTDEWLGLFMAYGRKRVAIKHAGASLPIR
jgi:hypothetical protein